MKYIRGNIQRLSGKQVLAIAVGCLIILGIGYIFSKPPAPTLPPEISKDITFSPFVLSKDSKNFTASDYKISTSEDKVQILSYVIKNDKGVAITVSEYPQPPQFTDIPEYKDRFLTNVAKQYDSVQTSNGTIYLGRLSKDTNRQLGVMLERGLLVLMSPDKDIDKTQWRSLGEQLDLQKVVD